MGMELMWHVVGPQDAIQTEGSKEGGGQGGRKVTQPYLGAGFGKPKAPAGEWAEQLIPPLETATA